MSNKFRFKWKLLPQHYTQTVSVIRLICRLLKPRSQHISSFEGFSSLFQTQTTNEFMVENWTHGTSGAPLLNNCGSQLYLLLWPTNLSQNALKKKRICNTLEYTLFHAYRAESVQLHIFQIIQNIIFQCRCWIRSHRGMRRSIIYLALLESET